MNNFNRITDFNGIEIYCRSGQISADMRAQLVQFWMANKAIDNVYDCWRRTFDVECVALNKQADIVAVSSVYIDRLAVGGSSYWFYRTFIESNGRLPGLGVALTRPLCSLLACIAPKQARPRVWLSWRKIQNLSAREANER